MACQIVDGPEELLLMIFSLIEMIFHELHFQGTDLDVRAASGAKISDL